jgi:hypothetical protein
MMGRPRERVATSRTRLSDLSEHEEALRVSTRMSRIPRKLGLCAIEEVPGNEVKFLG